MDRPALQNQQRLSELGAAQGVLWPEFQELSNELTAYLAEVIIAKLPTPKSWMSQGVWVDENARVCGDRLARRDDRGVTDDWCFFRRRSYCCNFVTTDISKRASLLR